MTRCKLSITPSLVMVFPWLFSVATLAEDAPRPNIVFILADDLGWRDLGCYGSDWASTPHLDRLAEQGIRFTDAYAPAPICSASRSAYLTGCSPARLHFEFVTKPQGVSPPRRQLTPPPYTQDLPLEEETIAEALSRAGYKTGFFGKWHVNEHYQRYLGWSPTHGPSAQGFDVAIEDFGSHPYGDKDRPASEKTLSPGKHPTDAVTQHAIQFLRDHQDQRFLLYLSHFYVHTPVKARTEWLLENYQDRKPTGGGDVEQRAHYGAFLESLDHYVGEVLAELDRLDLTDNTLVVFTSDNGGHPEYASNAPLRGSKWNLYEGGIRVPLIVRWPGKVEAGSIESTPVIGTDLFPTFCDIAGVKPTADALDGQSMVPVLTGKNTGSTRELVWHFPYYHPEKGYEKAIDEIGVNDFAVSKTKPQSAIRVGDHKLIHFSENNRDELYDLSKDIGEQMDMSRTHPLMTKQLRSRLDRYLKAANARLPVVEDPR